MNKLSDAMKFVRHLIHAKAANDASRPSRETIIYDYGALMACSPPLPTRIEDVSVLPYPKEVILGILRSSHVALRETGSVSVRSPPLAALSVPWARLFTTSRAHCGARPLTKQFPV